jgi:hypothetical protein
VPSRAAIGTQPSRDSFKEPLELFGSQTRDPEGCAKGSLPERPSSEGNHDPPENVPFDRMEGLPVRRGNFPPERSKARIAAGGKGC